MIAALTVAGGIGTKVNVLAQLRAPQAPIDQIAKRGVFRPFRI